jgi:hypothetical protein
MACLLRNHSKRQAYNTPGVQRTVCTRALWKSSHSAETALLTESVLCCVMLCCAAGAYVWSVGSFDVFGVHPVSSSSQGTFADSSITAMAKKLNGMP